MDEAYQFICSNEEINDKVTQMAQDEVYFALASLLSPYELPDGQWKEAFVCGSLSSTGDEFNYIVEDKYQEFMQELRILGFVEVDYEGYSLFYKE